MTKERSVSLDEAGTLEEVVEIINAGGTSSHSAAECAAQYAYDAAKESDFGTDAGNIHFHLEFLQDAGANFDASEALYESKFVDRS